MHSANFTAWSWLAAFVLPASALSAGSFEQPAPIRATMARAASGRSFQVIVSFRVW